MVDTSIKDGATPPRSTIKVTPHCPDCKAQLQEDRSFVDGRFACPNGCGYMLFKSNKSDAR